MAAEAAAADTPQTGPRTQHGRAPQLYHQRRVSQYPQGSETFWRYLHPPSYSKNFRIASALIFISYKKQKKIGNVLYHVPFPSVVEPEPEPQEP
jgi:hypothetical protein